MKELFDNIKVMSNYYTGNGDWGASTVGLKKISKTSVVMTALGDLDELNSLLGVIKCQHKKFNKNKFNKIINDIQENIFIVQAHVAAEMFGKLYKPPKFSKGNVAELENLIYIFEKQLKPVKKFIVPGSNESSAWLDYSRAVARRAERSVLIYSKKRKISPEIIFYLNRLSSLLFVIARVSAKRQKEQNPRY